MTSHETVNRSRRRRLSAALAAFALSIVVAAPARLAAQEAADGKKVGTERIVVTPQSPSAPSATTPVAAPTAAQPQTPAVQPATPQTPVQATPVQTTPIQPAQAPTAAKPADPKAAAQTPAKPAETPAPAKPAEAPTPAKPAGPPPEIHKGETDLPPQVARMRKRLLDAAYSGDMQKLRIVIQSNEMPPVFSVNEIGDPIDYIKSQSGDGNGLELLAILTDVLESSWARVNAGTPQEMYVWPAYAALPLDRLDPPQLVELYKVVTSSDLEEMKNVGRYTFYSVGIGPDGTWHWFRPAD